MKDLKSTTHVILVVLVGIVLASCSSDSGPTQPSGSNGSVSNRFVGEAYGGGVVFYTWKDARGTEHGLVVSVANLSDRHEWSNVSNYLGVTLPYDGRSNTSAIIAQTGHTSSAALLCKNYSAGGFNDWYLPTVQELGLLYSNIPAVNYTLASIAGGEQFKYFLYWSSLEGNDGTLGSASNNGIPSQGDKTAEYPVRAIRAF